LKIKKADFYLKSSHHTATYNDEIKSKKKTHRSCTKMGSDT